MPVIGETKLGRELGYKSLGSRYIWTACVSCGKERWTRTLHGEITNLLCGSCGYKGHEYKQKPQAQSPTPYLTESGYMEIRLNKDDFFYPMGYRGRVKMHRLVMAKFLNRRLLPWEIVHHRNGVKTDNRLENLKLYKAQAEHDSFIPLHKEINRLAKQMAELQKKYDLLVITK